MTPGQSIPPLTISIANFVIALHTDDQAVWRRLRDQYVDFLAPGLTPEINVKLHIVPNAMFVEPVPGPWVIESTYSADRLTYRSYLTRGELQLSSGEGVLEMAPNASVENYLRVIFAWLCLQNGGLLLHSAGVVRNGRGYVFFGPSGAGKTTTSRISAARAGATILSDDLVIIRRHEGRFWLFGVPFKGDLSDAPRANQRAPLQGIFRLRQDREHRIENIGLSTAVAELTAAAPFVVDKPELTNDLLDITFDIAREVPVNWLHFRRDAGYWNVIDEYFAHVPATA